MGVGITVELSPEDIAKGIKKMDKKDMETLLLIMSGKAKELSKRVRDIKNKKVKLLTRDELFRDVL